MSPGESVRCFTAAWLAGTGLGLLAGFLEPLGQRLRTLADILLGLAITAAWLEIGFGVCGGDLRLGCLAGLPLGAWLWSAGPGNILRPVWTQFWRGFFAFWRIFPRAGKKVWKIAKFLFPSEEKWVTIEGNRSFHGRHSPGGKQMEKKPKRKFVLRKSSKWVKVLCALVVLLALAAVAALQWVQHDLRALTEEKRQQAAGLEKENAELVEKTEKLGSVDSIQDIAESELGYVDPNAVVIGEK